MANKLRIHNVFNNGFTPMDYTFDHDDEVAAQVTFWNVVHKTEARGHNEHIDRMELKRGRTVLAMQRFIDGKMA